MAAVLMTWHTQFSFFRTAADLENEHLAAQIEDAAALMDLVVEQPQRCPEPAYYLWKDHLPALLIAGMVYSMEYTFHRGFEDKTFWKFSRFADDLVARGAFRYEPPPWFRDPDVCRSHRSTLRLRHPDVYDEELWPGTPERLPLLWPDPLSEPALALLRVGKEDLAAVRAKRLRVPSTIKPRIVNL